MARRRRARGGGLAKRGRRTTAKIAGGKARARVFLGGGRGGGRPPPQPPPLPQVGPPKGAIIGATLGGMAALVITQILLGRHHMHEQPHDFDTGFQFEMVLQTPLTLDGASVAAGVSASSAP